MLFLDCVNFQCDIPMFHVKNLNVLHSFQHLTFEQVSIFHDKLRLLKELEKIRKEANEEEISNGEKKSEQKSKARSSWGSIKNAFKASRAKRVAPLIRTLESN